MIKKTIFLMGAVLLALGSAAKASSGSAICEMNDKACVVYVDKPQTIVIRDLDRTKDRFGCAVYLGKEVTVQQLKVTSNSNMRVLELNSKEPSDMTFGAVSQTRGKNLEVTFTAFSVTKPQRVAMYCNYYPL